MICLGTDIPSRVQVEGSDNVANQRSTSQCKHQMVANRREVASWYDRLEWSAFQRRKSKLLASEESGAGSAKRIKILEENGKGLSVTVAYL